MLMKNEKGITLVELLVAVVIAGIIIVPLLTVMTGTFTRTTSQEKETQIAYVAQEVMEKIRLNPQYIPKPSNDNTRVYCYPDNNQKYTDKGCNELLNNMYRPTELPGNSFIMVYVSKYKEQEDPDKYPNFYEVEVKVLEDTKVVNGGENSTVTEKENSINLVTVVEIK